MDKDRVRAWWWQRQGLDGSSAGGTCASVLSRAGWARSIGGSNPYLTLWSRTGCSREAVDADVASLQIHELPCARGCTYVVPAEDYELALQAAVGFGDGDMKVARKFGVTDEEIDKLCRKIVDAVQPEPLEPDGIRKAVGDAARNLGPEAAKKGVTTTLPLALGKLQAAGEIRRIPVNGRLDQQRYKYARWNLRPKQRDDTFTELARRYFRWIGPATVAEFQWFSGLGAKTAQEAVAPLGLVTYGGRLMFADDFDRMMSMTVPDTPDYKLVGSLDGIAQLRRDVLDLVAGEDMGRVASTKDLPSNAILDRGRLVGLWEYDPEAGSIVWSSFIHSCRIMRRAVKETEDFVRQDLGDVRTFSLDSPKSRKPRLEALRASS